MRPNFWHTYPFLSTYPTERRGVITTVIAIVVVLAIVELVLKGFALWRAAQAKQAAWFVLLLIFNTAGLLPLIYLLLSRAENQRVP